MARDPLLCQHLPWSNPHNASGRSSAASGIHSRGHWRWAPSFASSELLNEFVGMNCKWCRTVNQVWYGFWDASLGSLAVSTELVCPRTNHVLYTEWYVNTNQPLERLPIASREASFGTMRGVVRTSEATWLLATRHISIVENHNTPTWTVSDRYAIEVAWFRHGDGVHGISQYQKKLITNFHTHFWVFRLLDHQSNKETIEVALMFKDGI